MKSRIKSLAVALLLGGGLLVAPSPAEAAPPKYVSTNRVYGDVFGSCGYAIMFGQYGGSAYATILNYGSGSGCRYFNVEVALDGNTPKDRPVWWPRQSKWYQVDKAGTIDGAAFVVKNDDNWCRATQYNVNGSSAVRTGTNDYFCG